MILRAQLLLMEQALLELPSALQAAGVRLRPEVEADVPFLEQMYREVRWSELDATQWPESSKREFLACQFALQRRHYLTHYGGAEFDMVEQHGAPIGRLYLHRGTRDHRIVDISLLGARRGGGIGGALIQTAINEAKAAGRTVSIHVEAFNPAMRLYKRLGFRQVEQSGPYWRMEWYAE